MKKILVGILKTIENEYQSSRKAIDNQKYTNFDCLLIENLSNKKAHDKLFSTFIEKKSKYDYLIKIDADTVLKKNTVFNFVVDLFNKNTEVKFISLILYDFFTRKPLFGITCYRNNIKLIERDEIFVDRIVDLKKNESLFIHNPILGVHSPNPSDYQAIHFGYHRRLKKQFNVIKNLFIAFLFTFNKKRALALVGAMHVDNGHLKATNNTTYVDTQIEKVLDKFKNKSLLYLFFYIIFQYLFLRNIRRIVRKIIFFLL